MTTYLSVGAIQVQTWITRTVSRLALLRGASIALSKETAHDRIDIWLESEHYSSRTAKDAGNVDGVVVIAMHDDEASYLPARLLDRLRSRLPGIQWEAWTANGASYLNAFGQYLAGEGSRYLQHLPAMPELGVVRSCGYCGTEPATKQASMGDDDEWLGDDCLMRMTTWRNSQKEDRSRVRREVESLDWQTIPGRWPKDFEMLAAKGGIPAEGDRPMAIGRRGSRSHLALIAADGNGIGRLFDRIADADVPGLRENAVAELTETTRQAVIECAKAYCADPEYKVVLPHYVGGDDVLLSVPAAAAWQVAAELGRQFEVLGWRLRQYLPGDVDDLEDLKTAIDGVGIGIGIVFAPRSHPIAGTVPLASRALAEAKSVTKGGESAIGWLDITEGAGEQDCHTVGLSVALAQLSPGGATDVFQLGPSARGVLGIIVREGPGRLEQRVGEWAERTQHTLTTVPGDLPALLSRARWWPDVSEDEREPS